MFAVPGWSVSADSLKSEKAAPAAAAAAGSAKPSRKRKRAGNNKELESVTASNVADLWESVVEGKKKPVAEKAAPAAKKQKSKKQKTTKGDGDDDGEQETKGENGVNGNVEDKPATTQSQQQQAPSASKKDKKQKTKNKDKPKNANDQPSEPPPAVAASTAAAAAALPPVLPPAPPKLTPLQASMRQKLVSARFRHLNETLYTRPSAESLDLFASDPSMFGEYHEGFRQQVKVWPENPVDSFLADLRRRGKARSGPPSRRGRSNGGGGSKKDDEAAGGKGGKADVLPLPRTQGTCVIADLGCGDARLAQELQADKDRLRLDVRSYDLQSPHPLVTRADVADLPLADGSVDVAVFCLALMGTNWLDFVEEAYRVLHWKGELWVAEIKSRFGTPRRGKGKNAPVAHSVGNRKKVAAAAAKKGKAAEDGNDEDLAVEVDGQDDRRRETDVSAFVEALGKRGFVLQGGGGGDGNRAVDLSNKMFVKMHFVKAAAPTRGKGVKEAEARRPPSRGMQKWRQQVQDDEDDDGGDEASILKPCVYKIR